MEEENSQPLHRGGDNNGPGPPESSIRVRSRHDSFLILCRCFGLIVALAAIFCIVVNVLSAIQSFKNGSDIFDGIFRCYAVVIAMFVVAFETEWGFIMKFLKVFEYWVARGMLQIFVAVMTRAYPEDFKRHRVLFLLQSIASYMLLACGAIYVISGVLCIGIFKRARQNKKVSKDQAIKDLQDLERRREELESLLIVQGA